MVFIIDLPKLQTAEQRDAQQITPFGEELFYFLRAQGLDEKLVSSLRNYDFTETNRYSFVHTMQASPPPLSNANMVTNSTTSGSPGSHTTEDAWRRTGKPSPLVPVHTLFAGGVRGLTLLYQGTVALGGQPALSDSAPRMPSRWISW